MATYRHNIRNIRSRTVNGKPIYSAKVYDEGRFVRWMIVDIYGNQYLDGGNFTTPLGATESLRKAIDA